jgi:HK97 family phage major capsid protein
MNLKVEKTQDGKLLLSEDDLRSVVSNAVQEASKQLLTELSNKFPTPTIINAPVTKDAVSEKRSKIVRFFKALNDQDRETLLSMVDLGEVKALNEGSGGAGGFLVPTEFASDLIMMLEDFSVARRYSTIVPMRTLSVKLNSLTGKVTAYWTDELTDITASQPVFAEPVLTAKKLSGLTAWSSEIFEDSEVNIVQNLMLLYAEAFGAKEDDQFFNGANNPFTGIFNVSGTVTTTLSGTTLSTLTYDKIVECVNSLSRGQLANGTPTWYMHRTVLSYFQNVKDSQNRPIFIQGSGSLPDTILGFPVEKSEACPSASSIAANTKFAIFGNLKPWCYFGDRRAITSRILNEGTVGTVNLATADGEALRITERVGIVIAAPGNIAVMKTSA